jgi:predicted nucleic acid-binding protein
VLVDIFAADPEHGPSSREALRECMEGGGLLACDIVWAEVASGFSESARAGELLDSLGVAFSALDRVAALAAADAFRAYRLAGGRRERVAADFLIGAHAAENADRLLTRDRGFFRSYFSAVDVVDPSS